MYKGIILHWSDVAQYGVANYTVHYNTTSRFNKSTRQTVVHSANVLTGNPRFSYLAFETGDPIVFDLQDNIAIHVQYLVKKDTVVDMDDELDKKPAPYAITSSDEEESNGSPLLRAPTLDSTKTPKTERVKPKKKKPHKDVKEPNEFKMRQPVFKTPERAKQIQ